jgi:hypothetical protein
MRPVYHKSLAKSCKQGANRNNEVQIMLWKVYYDMEYLQFPLLLDN